MKKHSIILKLLAIIIMASSSMFLVSCEDAIDDSLPPEIEMVRVTNPEEANVPLENAGLGQTIVIVGKNFHNLEEIRINGIVTLFNPALATDTHIIVQIDDDTPTLATAPDVSNELRVVTKGGEATKSFIILPPPPIISSISNEFAQADETLIIKGQYFFFVEEVIFPGGVTSQDLTSSANGRTLNVVVPQGITEAGSVVVVTESGSADSAPKWRFNDRTGIFCDFEGINPFGAWGSEPVIDNATPIEAGGSYLKVFGADVPSPMWWNNAQVVPMDGVNFPSPTSSTPSDYAIKFELNTVNPWNSGWFEVNLNWTYFMRFMPWNTPKDPAEHWEVDPDERIDFDTQGWQTMVIPMNLFRLKPGNDPSGDMISLDAFSWINGMVMAFQNPDPPRGVEIDELHLLFDNFRLVRIAN